MSSKKSFPLRLNEPMYDALKRWADDELRSVNAQIEYLLRDALRKAGRMPRPDDDVPGTEPGGEESGAS